MYMWKGIGRLIPDGMRLKSNPAQLLPPPPLPILGQKKENAQQNRTHSKKRLHQQNEEK
jgi:hypothetical protein